MGSFCPVETRSRRLRLTGGFGFVCKRLSGLYNRPNLDQERNNWLFLTMNGCKQSANAIANFSTRYAILCIVKRAANGKYNQQFNLSY